MRTRRLVVIGAVGWIVAAACYSDEITNVQELASVTTLVDSQAPLRSARTFALPDTVIHAMRDGGTATTGHAGDSLILNQIRAGFISLGWREITDVRATRADVVILTAVLEQEQTGVAYGSWWSDWGYWPGWPTSYGGYGWGYPGAAVEFTYVTGTLLITMLDLLHGDASTKQVPLLWAAAINGVLTSSSLEGALDGITQAFVQSPYLERP
jgi:hypothetical protein